MNIEKIKKVCVSQGEMLLINAESGQWIGTGEGLYRVEGVVLKEEGLPAVFGLTPKESAVMEITEETATDGLSEKLTEIAGRAGDELCERAAMEIIEASGERLVQITGMDTGRREWIKASLMAPAAKKGQTMDIYMHNDTVLLTQGMNVDAVIAMREETGKRAIEEQLRMMIDGERMDELPPWDVEEKAEDESD